jgi:hypothetical protein
MVDLKFPDDRQLQPEIMKDRQVFFSDPLITVWQGVMVLPGRKKGKPLSSISVVRGWVIAKGVLPDQVVVHEATSLESAINMVLTGHTDGLWVNIQVGVYTPEHVLNKSGALVFDEALPIMPFRYSLSSLRRGDVIEQFNQFLLTDNTFVHSRKMRYGI